MCNRFARLMDSDGFAYDYNPCAGFTGPYECVEVQVANDSPYKLSHCCSCTVRSVSIRLLGMHMP